MKRRRIQTAVELVHRHEHEKEALRPRLEVLESRLCMSRGFIIGALNEAGLTLVVLKDPK